ncbi:MAG: eCIS core domain-containing protein [Thermoanaerobaculia bacterium]
MNHDERDGGPPPSPPSSFILHPSSFRPSGLHPSDLHPSLKDAVAAARAKVRVGYPWWLRPLLARDVVAITLGRRIYVRGMLESASFERLLRHELAHVRQVERLGLLVFLWRYVVEFVRNWMQLRSFAAAYAAISFEIEARAAEEDDS